MCAHTHTVEIGIFMGSFELCNIYTYISGCEHCALRKKLNAAGNLHSNSANLRGHFNFIRTEASIQFSHYSGPRKRAHVNQPIYFDLLPFGLAVWKIRYKWFKNHKVHWIFFDVFYELNRIGLGQRQNSISFNQRHEFQQKKKTVESRIWDVIHILRYK